MFSTTALLSALAIAALGLNAIDSAPVPPGAGTGSTLTVDADGSADYDTISAAVATAADGDTILVRPGTYTEAVVIDKDITLTGDGPREEIVLKAPEDGPQEPIPTGQEIDEPYAILLRGTPATVSGLTMQGQPSRVHISGGSPTITDLDFDSVGWAYEGGASGAGNAIIIGGASTATVTDNLLRGGGGIGVMYAEPLIEGNELLGGSIIQGVFGDGAVVRGNTIKGALDRGLGIYQSGPFVVEGNTIADAGVMGVYVFNSRPIIRENTITGSGALGISVDGVGPTIAGNTLSDNKTAISWVAFAGSIENNHIDGGKAGLVINSGQPSVTGNTIEGVDGTGLFILKGTAPTLSENTVCGNKVNLKTIDGANPTIDDSNETLRGRTRRVALPCGHHHDRVGRGDRPGHRDGEDRGEMATRGARSPRLGITPRRWLGSRLSRLHPDPGHPDSRTNGLRASRYDGRPIQHEASDMTQPPDRESEMLADGGSAASAAEAGRTRPRWRSLPRRARAFRVAHVAWGAVAMGALSYIWMCAVVGRRDRFLWASVAFLLVQGVALLIGRGNCPFGPFQRSLGDPVPMFELVLPPRAAKAAIPMLALVTVAGMIAVIVRPTHDGGTSAHMGDALASSSTTT